MNSNQRLAFKVLNRLSSPIFIAVLNCVASIVWIWGISKVRDLKINHLLNFNMNRQRLTAKTESVYHSALIRSLTLLKTVIEINFIQ